LQAGFPGLWSVLRHGKQMTRRAAFAAWRLSHRICGREMVPVTVFGEFPLVVRTDDFRGYRVWQTRGSQRDKIALVRSICAARPGVFVDVGANYGEFSLVPAALGIQCLLFEPNPTIVPCLHRTFSKLPHVAVNHKALGAHAGRTLFHYNTAGSGSGSLIDAMPKADSLWDSSEGVQGYEVELSTLDAEIAASGSDLSRGLLIKIDVEGYEREVLEGAESVLARAAWWRGLVEFSPSALRAGGKSVEAQWDYFRRFEGMIVSSESAAAETLERARLPETPPAGDVDLLVGRGALPPAAAATP
jgi:FkbM family methyltransferase